MEGSQERRQHTRRTCDYFIRVTRLGPSRERYYGRTVNVGRKGALAWIDNVDRPFTVGEGLEIRIYVDDGPELKALTIRAAGVVSRTEPRDGTTLPDHRQGLAVQFERELDEDWL